MDSPSTPSSTSHTSPATLSPTSLPPATMSTPKILKVDRSAAAQAMNAIRRAARIKTGPGLRERLEIRARQLERTGGSIEEDLKGESANLLSKAQDFQQSRAGDQMFSSEANAVVVRLQRALWYVDVFMRGLATDARSAIQSQRITTAQTRLEEAIKEVESFGVQRQLVMRATWVLSRFQKWGQNNIKIRRDKNIEKLRTIIPDDWLKKTITRKYDQIEEKQERGIEVAVGLENLAKFKPARQDSVSSSSSSSEAESESASASEGEADAEGEGEETKAPNPHQMPPHLLQNDGFAMSEETATTVDTIVARRARRKEKEKDRNREIQRETKRMMKKMKKERKRKRKEKKQQLATMREVDEMTTMHTISFRKSKSLHRSMSHVVARPPSPEERWEEGMYSDYEEYDKVGRGEGGEGGSGEGKPEAMATARSEFLVADGSDGNGTDNTSGNSDSDELPAVVAKKTKIFSMDEILAMHAETDFGEDVITFLDGSGLVKNTGPAARVKFVRMMKISYLDIRTKKLQRTKKIVHIIKKIKKMLRRILLMPTDEDLIVGDSDAANSGAQTENDANTEPVDIDALLDAKEQKITVRREEDLDIFKRWAGKKVVALEPLLSEGMEGRVGASSVHTEMDSKRGSSSGSSVQWVCKVCMQLNQENALVCLVCGRPPNAKAIGWGLAKHRPRRTHPRFMYTWNQKTGKTIRQWEKQEQEALDKREQSGRLPTMAEEMKEKFFVRTTTGGVVVP